MTTFELSLLLELIFNLQIDTRPHFSIEASRRPTTPPTHIYKQRSLFCLHHVATSPRLLDHQTILREGKACQLSDVIRNDQDYYSITLHTARSKPFTPKCCLYLQWRKSCITEKLNFGYSVLGNSQYTDMDFKCKLKKHGFSSFFPSMFSPPFLLIYFRLTNTSITIVYLYPV